MQPKGPGATGAHDVGGLLIAADAAPLDLKDKTYQLWERQVHALQLALVRKGLLTVDEMRRAIEGLTPEQQERMSYYEKWAAAVTAICLERGTLTADELDAQMGAAVEEPTHARYKQGDIVRVKDEEGGPRWRKPHLRTPGYVHGVIGVIERESQGLFGNPEALAFRRPAPKQPMYRVRFLQADLWEGYVGGGSDAVDVEVYEPWLEPSTQQALESQQAARAQRQAMYHHVRHDHDHDHDHHHSRLLGMVGGHSRPCNPNSHVHEGRHAIEGGKAGASEHTHDDGSEPHTHEGRCAVETAAVDKEDPEDCERRRVAEAVIKALTIKGVVTADELREGVEKMDSMGQQSEGARLVVRAWTDPAFKQRLLQDAGSAAAELGISASVYPSAKPSPNPDQAQAEHKDAAKTGKLPVSCYPLSVLGMSPAWYKSRAYRARAVRDPRGVLKEFGTTIPEDVTVVVHDSTADNRYIVLPLRPAGTEGWSEQQLTQLVTRDSMLGVSLAKTSEQTTQV